MTGFDHARSTAIVTGPAAYVGGGVAYYVEAVIVPHVPRVTIVTVGRRGQRENRRIMVRRYLRDALCVLHELRERSTGILQVNPSLDPRSLIRDGLFLLMARVTRTPTVVFFHGWMLPTEAHLRGVALWLFKRVFLRADGIAVLFTGFEGKLREWGYGGPILVATTAISDDEAGALERSTLAKRGSSAGPIHLLFMARIVEEKGIFDCLQAYRVLRVAGWPLTLSVAGDGPARSLAEEWVRLNGDAGVTFLGDVRGPEKHRLMNQCDIYVLPSRDGEGMPTTVVEAMYYGQSIVSSRLGGLNDFFETGEMGAAIQGRGAPELVKALTVLLEDPPLRQDIAGHNHAFAAKHFRAPIAASRLMKLYDMAVSDHEAGTRTPRVFRWFEVDKGDSGR